MADAPLLELDSIETCYGLSQVLFGMSLAIAPGEMVTLMGRNGMGKTTTVRSIMGLTQAMAGAIRFGGARSAACRPIRSPSSASGWCRRGARSSPISRVRENLVATAANRSGAAEPWTLGEGLRAVSPARRAASATWRTSFPAASSRCWRSAAR